MQWCVGRLVPLIACATVLVGAACAGGDDLGPTATVPTAVSSPSPSSVAATTVVPAGADPFAIPEVIDAAYVNRVLAALYRVDGDVFRSVVQTGSIGEEHALGLAAIYAEPQLSFEIDQLQRSILDLRNVRSPPGDRVVQVVKVIQASARCIVVETQFNYEAVLVEPEPPRAGIAAFVALVSGSSVSDRLMSNPTPWLILNAAYLSSGQELIPSCT